MDTAASAPPLEAFSDADLPSPSAPPPNTSSDALPSDPPPMPPMPPPSPPMPAPPVPGLGSLGVHEPYVRSLVRRTADWPRQGVTFLDISPLLADSRALKQCIEALVERYGGGYITHVAGIDARGFTIGCALAYALNCGFIMVRKAGKLPPRPGGDAGSVLSEEYELEYGKGQLEVAGDSFDTSRVTSPRVLLADDLLATGGTASAACNLLRLAGATIVEVAVVMEISSKTLQGRRRLKEEGYIDLHALMTFTE